jgi:hypothetical protein
LIPTGFTIPLLDTAIRLIDVPPDRVTITDPAHPLYGRQFDLIPATGPTTARALARVAYSATVVLKIPVAATNLHPAPPALPRSKLSLDGIRDLLRLTARDGGTGQPVCTGPQPDGGLPSMTAPPPSGR